MNPLPSPSASHISSIEVWEYCIPLQPPAPVAERHGIILLWHLHDGRRFWSEVAPLPGFSPEGLKECRQACETWLAQDAAARTVDEVAPAGLADLPAAARFAIEAGRLQALHKLPAAQRVKLCSLIDPSQQGEIDGADAELAGLAADLTCLKVKVGRHSVAEDIDKLRLIHDKLPSHVKLRLDANRAWTLEQAEQVCGSIPAQRIDYVEEPLLAGSCYRNWTSHLAVPFAWDETIREYPEADLHTPGLKALVIKPMLTGLARTLAWLETASAAQRQIVLSAAFESNLTLDLYARLCALWQLSGYQGLGTFDAWPVCLIEPLRSQSGHDQKPIISPTELTYLGRWL
ncbi:o-succinylbenzoate synthase [Halorhodospira halochloris]|nr:o-succinylbenzoate synthase [Halorhodospira halochloris]MBK1650769.1 o-succinylbenzoate synthase [Halorhodospira halochloris]